MLSEREQQAWDLLNEIGPIVEADYRAEAIARLGSEVGETLRKRLTDLERMGKAFRHSGKQVSKATGRPGQVWEALFNTEKE